MSKARVWYPCAPVVPSSSMMVRALAVLLVAVACAHADGCSFQDPMVGVSEECGKDPNPTAYGCSDTGTRKELFNAMEGQLKEGFDRLNLPNIKELTWAALVEAGFIGKQIDEHVPKLLDQEQRDMKIKNGPWQEIVKHMIKNKHLHKKKETSEPMKADDCAFWTGGIPVSLYARGLGFTTLEGTLAGHAFDDMDAEWGACPKRGAPEASPTRISFKRVSPLWNIMSKTFAAECTGRITVFMRAIDPSSVLSEQEFPQLVEDNKAGRNTGFRFVFLIGNTPYKKGKETDALKAMVQVGSLTSEDIKLIKEKKMRESGEKHYTKDIALLKKLSQLANKGCDGDTKRCCSGMKSSTAKCGDKHTKEYPVEVKPSDNPAIPYCCRLYWNGKAATNSKKHAQNLATATDLDFATAHLKSAYAATKDFCRARFTQSMIEVVDHKTSEASTNWKETHKQQQQNDPDCKSKDCKTTKITEDPKISNWDEWLTKFKSEEHQLANIKYDISRREGLKQGEGLNILTALKFKKEGMKNIETVRIEKRQFIQEYFDLDAISKGNPKGHFTRFGGNNDRTQHARTEEGKETEKIAPNACVNGKDKFKMWGDFCKDFLNDWYAADKNILTSSDLPGGLGLVKRMKLKAKLAQEAAAKLAQEAGTVQHMYGEDQTAEQMQEGRKKLHEETKAKDDAATR